jgi:hypothetical protein
LSVQSVLVDETVEVEFSPDLFCRFAKCSRCGVYVWKVSNKLKLFIGDVVPYGFFHGDLVCIGCLKVVSGRE